MAILYVYASRDAGVYTGPTKQHEFQFVFYYCASNLIYSETHACQYISFLFIDYKQVKRLDSLGIWRLSKEIPQRRTRGILPISKPAYQYGTGVITLTGLKE